jgi:uncharacterized ferritin-like protein (DUF455 family)
MELRAFAERVLLSDSITAKVEPITVPFTDQSPGESVHIEKPSRPENLQFGARRSAPPMPKPGAFQAQQKRAIAHHILANHELQALEVMAFMLLRFPEADHEFRMGLAEIMQDEQRHTRMHIERAQVLGVRFGDFPVNSYIWEKAQLFENLLDYLATLPLVFEGRNLDHTLEFATYFSNADDERSAALMRVIHRDEIQHVAFGMEWLRKLKPAESTEWETFAKHLKWPLRPSKAKGNDFQEQARRDAGMTDEFINALQQAQEDDISGPPA